MKERHKILIDTDPGVDDAIAILLAHAWFDPSDILAVTTTAGNVGIEATTRNALGLKKILNAPFEVYRGAQKPLKVPFRDAAHIHGAGGMGHYEFDQICELTSDEPAWDAIYRLAKREGKVILITLAPLTNIALALQKYPDLPDYIDVLYSMGGSIGKGNRTPYSEFNYYCDPHAADIVFTSGMNIYMVGLNVTEKAFGDQMTMDQLVPENHLINSLITSLKSYYRGTLSDESVRTGYHLPDAVAVAACIDRSLCVFEQMHISIVTEEGDRQGMSRVESSGTCSVHVATDVDVERFREMLLAMNSLNA